MQTKQTNLTQTSENERNGGRGSSQAVTRGSKTPGKGGTRVSEDTKLARARRMVERRTATSVEPPTKKIRGRARAAPRRRTETMAVPASEPHSALAVFARDVGRFEVLDAAGEQRIARDIEARETEQWQRIFGFAPVAVRVVDFIGEQLGAESRAQAVDLCPLRRAATAVIERGERGRESAGPPDAAAQAVLDQVARQTAERMRAADRERHLLDQVMAALERMERGEDERPAGVTRAAFAAFLRPVRAAARHAARARDAFVEANLRLVFMVARQYLRPGGVPMADLVQEGNLGLMAAVDRFDYRRGLRFSTYATWWIRHMIGRAVANKSRTVRVPVYLLESKQHLERSRFELTRRLGRAPTEEELMNETGLSRNRLETVRSLVGSGHDVSLDQPMGEHDDQPRIEIFRDPDSEEGGLTEEVVLRDQVAHLTSAMDHLTPKEVDILRKRFALEGDREWTLNEIAQNYGVTRERIRQVQNRALSKLRKALVEANTEADFAA